MAEQNGLHNARVPAPRWLGLHGRTDDLILHTIRGGIELPRPWAESLVAYHAYIWEMVRSHYVDIDEGYFRCRLTSGVVAGLRQATPPDEHEDDVVVPQITVSGPNTLNEPLHVVASPRNK